MSHHHDAKAGHHRKQKPSKLTKAVRCATRSCTDECARRDRPSAALRQLLSRCSPESCGGSALGCTHALAQAGFEDASKENFGVGCVRANVCLAVLPSVCALQSRPSRRSPSSVVSAAVPCRALALLTVGCRPTGQRARSRKKHRSSKKPRTSRICERH